MDHSFKWSVNNYLEDLVVLDSELVAASQIGFGCLTVCFNTLRELEGATKIWIVIVSLVAVAVQMNVISTTKDCTIIFVAKNNFIFKVIEFFNGWIVVVFGVDDSEEEGGGVVVFVIIGAIPWQFCEAPKHPFVGLDDGEGGSLVVTFFVECLGWKTVLRSSQEELELVWQNLL